MKRKGLRSGYTTGACAAAAAKAAAMLLMSSELGVQSLERILSVEIPFPDGSRVNFKIYNSKLITLNSKLATASVIKDAGDDPDVTNGAEIMAEVRIQDTGFRIQDKKNHESCIMHHASSTFQLSPLNFQLLIKGGKGVGIITKPGLSIPVGEPAINPVPRRMITEAVMEGVQGFKGSRVQGVEVTISVTDGEILAKKTLNPRLGIVGGISILGTTGIVKPLSTEAWTASISSAMDVAVATGNQEIVLSAGRVSEKAHMKKFNFPEEAYIMMGDYLEFSILDAKKHQFKKIHLCAQWAKMLKIAMATPQTHVRHGAIDTRRAVEFLNNLGIKVPQEMQFNTAREIFDLIQSAISNQQSAIFSKVCSAAKKYVEGITSGVPVIAHLVSYEGEIIVSSE